MPSSKRFVVDTANLSKFEQQSQKFIERLAQYFSGDKKMTTLAYLVGEVEANIKEHSNAKAATFFFEPATGEFSLEDDGIGIGASFRKSGKNVDDSQAIHMALRGASTKKGHRGFGFRTIIALAKHLQGRVGVISGNAGIVVARNGVRKRKGPKRTGTSVIISLPRNLEIDDQTFYTIIEGLK